MTTEEIRRGNNAQTNNANAAGESIRLDIPNGRRFGKPFRLGNPYIEDGGGLVYCWPGNSKEPYEQIFRDNKDKVGDFLLEKARAYIKDFEVWTYAGYPHLQISDDGPIVHIGDGGRWIEFVPSSIGGMASLHNLDGYHEQSLGFDLTSDLLEKLDSEIIAPRISKEYIIEYALPKGFKSLPENSSVLNPQWLEKMCGVLKLGQFKGLKVEKDNQTIEIGGGEITTRDGFCKASGFLGSHIRNATFLVAKLVDSCTADL
jgi:hypothetical protein